MVKFSREAQSQSLSFFSLDRPFSNFDFIDEHYGSFPSLRRIMLQVRSHNASTMVREEIDPAASLDLLHEGEDLSKLLGFEVQTIVHRLSFFKRTFSSELDLLEATDADFVGYAIVKIDFDLRNARDPGSYRCLRVFESVLLPSRHGNNFVHGAQRWSCRIGGATLNTHGYVYAQQNGDTNVCAHVACRTVAARFHPQGDMGYREMNALLGRDFSDPSEGRGLDTGQMVQILESAGARCISWDYERLGGSIQWPYQKLVYGSIESGYPSILIFATSEGSRHAVPVFGHTFNEDMWAPNANWSYFHVGTETNYIPSDSWLSTFLMHDDNWGSNYCVPPAFLSVEKSDSDTTSQTSPLTTSANSLTHIIATLPSDVKGSPVEAEAIGAEHLLRLIALLSKHDQPSWGKRLDASIQQKRVVLRTLLISREKCLEHLSTMRDWDDTAISPEQIALIDELALSTSKRLWMVEVSMPELFSANKRKLGEVLLSADKDFESADSERLFENYVLARTPGYFVFHNDESSVPFNYKFIPSTIKGHVPLYGCDS